MSKKILAIDDHPDTIQLIELALQRHGYQVIGAFSGPEGLEIAERELPDLILLDMMMPGMDGNAVCRAIRQNPDLARTPIIMFTAKSQATDKKDSFDAGADDYLTKPTRPTELLQRIQALLSRHDFELQADLPDEGPPAIAVQPPAPRFIAVMGSRGGVGATTVALNLAAALADAEVDTTLVDLDTRQGHLALYVGHKAGADLLDWLDHAGPLDETLPEYQVEIQPHLLLLPSRLRLDGNHLPPASQLPALTTTLAETRRSIVVDLGAHAAESVQPILQRCDAVLVCLRPERAAIVGARHLLEQLPALVDSHKLQPVLVDYNAGETMPRAAIEFYLQRPLSAILRLNPREITRAVNRHQPLVFSAADGEAMRQFRQLLNVLAPAGQN